MKLKRATAVLLKSPSEPLWTTSLSPGDTKRPEKLISRSRLSFKAAESRNRVLKMRKKPRLGHLREGVRCPDGLGRITAEVSQLIRGCLSCTSVMLYYPTGSIVPVQLPVGSSSRALPDLPGAPYFIQIVQCYKVDPKAQTQMKLSCLNTNYDQEISLSIKPFFFPVDLVSSAFLDKICISGWRKRG